MGANASIPLPMLMQDLSRGQINTSSRTRNCSKTGRAAGITPRSFAVITMPNVPRTGIPKVAAQRRAAKSSRITSVPGFT